MNVHYSDGTVTVLHGDCRVELADLEPDSIDACVTDPPYELSSDGKASAARVVAEVMFPQHRNRPAGAPSECHLGFLAAKVAELCGVGAIPRPAATVPVGAVALDEEPTGRDGDIEHRGPTAGSRVPEPDRRVDDEPEAPEHLGSFLLELADIESGVDALNRAGSSFDAGGFRVGLGVAASSLSALARSGGAVPLGDDVVRAIDDTLAALVGATGRAEELAVSYPLLTRGADEDTFTTSGALTFLALAKASAAQLVPALAGTGLVPSGAEPRRIRVVDPRTHRALTFDLFLHAHLADVTSTGFMGAKWDGSKVAYDIDVWRQVYRVLKPGAHLIVFGAPRTWHRVAVAVEDAGFEIRDTILAWANGEGFPKSQNVSKAIDKAAGAERPVIGSKLGQPGYTLSPNDENAVAAFGDGFSTKTAEQRARETEVTAPATEAAARWDGWGTALKPAIEPIILARKPLDGTVVNNVLTYGTGALNIDAARVGYQDQADKRLETRGVHSAGTYEGLAGGSAFRKDSNPVAAPHDGGRWPANLVLVHHPDCRPTGEMTEVPTRTNFPASRGASTYGNDGFTGQDATEASYSTTTESVEEWVCVEGCPVAALDAQSGVLVSGGGNKANRKPTPEWQVPPTADTGQVWASDSGGASRFFARFGHAIDEQIAADGPVRYVAKASQRERPSYKLLDPPTTMLRLRSDLTDEQRAHVLERLREAGVDVG